MNFLRGFIIFASLAVATIHARASSQPYDYDKGKEDLDFNFKVLLEAIKENKEEMIFVKEQMMNQIKLMDEKIEHFYKLIIEEKNSKTELQKELNQRIIEDENELSQLKSIIVELNQLVNEEKNNKTVLQEKNLELNQRIQECCGQILDKDGTENIFQALEKGSLIGVKYWLSKDPSSIHAKNGKDYNHTPLFYASAYGHLDILEFLLSKGVDLEVESSFNHATPLMFASYNGHVHVVEALLDKGANINHQNKNKWTALHWAVFGDKLEIVKLLIDRGADRSLRNVENRTPLDWARERGYKSIVNYLSSL